MLLIICFAALFAAGIASATEIAYVDTDKLMKSSIPGRLGRNHLIEVQKVLQQGLNSLIKYYEGKENTPEARRNIADGRMKVEQQMAIEQQAVMNIIQKEMEAATKAWRAKNPKYDIVVSKGALLDANPALDKTKEVMIELDNRKPTFPPLPKVNVNK